MKFLVKLRQKMCVRYDTKEKIHRSQKPKMNSHNFALICIALYIFSTLNNKKSYKNVMKVNIIKFVSVHFPLGHFFP